VLVVWVIHKGDYPDNDAADFRANNACLASKLELPGTLSLSEAIYRWLVNAANLIIIALLLL
jgi:hypothetical protein